jgi:DNA repair protein RecO (recombination protein O)
MEWTDDGIILGVRRHGEGSVIAELLTRGHGRHLGLVRGGTGARMRPVLQPGNTVRAVWRARLDEHLGNYAIEVLTSRAANLMTASHAVYGVTHLGSLVRLLPERDPHENIFEMLESALDHFDDARHAAVQLARFELAMLTELGFGLDLSTCAATGATQELVYVSPKSGNAVSRSAGEPWRDKLLRLPSFLQDEAGKASAPATDDELRDGFTLTGMFLLRHVLEPRGQMHSDARAGFIAAVMRRRPAA